MYIVCRLHKGWQNLSIKTMNLLLSKPGFYTERLIVHLSLSIEGIGCNSKASTDDGDFLMKTFTGPLKRIRAIRIITILVYLFSCFVSVGHYHFHPHSPDCCVELEDSHQSRQSAHFESDQPCLICHFITVHHSSTPNGTVAPADPFNTGTSEQDDRIVIPILSFAFAIRAPPFS